jgi:PEP-CTERM motif
MTGLHCITLTKVNRTRLLVSLTAFLFLFSPRPAVAGLIFPSSGINGETGNFVSGTAEFTISSMDLLVTLTNTSAPLGTNGDVLTGVRFVPSITPLTLTKAEVLAAGTVWTDKSTSASGPVDWTSHWTDLPGATPLPAGTIGAAATGYSGTFPNPSGAGADYGIVSNGTYPQGGNGPGNPNKFPLAENSLVLTFSSSVPLDGLTITDVGLLFGTGGNGTVFSVPEPASWLLALLGVSAAIRRRR